MDLIEEPKQYYARAVKNQTPSRKLSTVNINNHQTLPINNKLQSSHATKAPPQKQGKSPS